ncbi:MAG: RNA methyltransferase [Betaproteobacteria bacterium]|nr:MAG: RNA methyltransferase [Betaproteobacteria bacterium]TMH80551.1 MAG: RNA methyltransferase [Betaproteobacteria bacterium]
MKAGGPLSRIRVVLLRPSHPGNIGAAARAMKTMGITQLRLVRPKRFPHPDARAMASGALDVLESARACASLEEALAGTTYSLALSARERELSHCLLDARAAARELLRAARKDEVAVVFGNETAGLSNKEIMRCSALARIPANPEYPSLNLAQAVQVIAYELRRAAQAPPAAPARTAYATHEEIEKFFAHLERSLRASGYLHPRYPRKLMDRLRRLFAKARLETVEVNILRGMLAAWDDRSPPGNS